MDCDYFISIEQDLLISETWWNSIVPHMEKPNVAVAQGLRLPQEAQRVVRSFEEYRLDRYKELGLPIFSMDNAIFRSFVAKSVGRIPSELRYTGVDTYVYRNVLSRGYRWVVDYDVVSTHLRQGGIREQMDRYYRYGMDSQILEKYELSNHSRYIRRGSKSAVAILLFSPIRGLLIGMTKRCPQIAVYYPLVRLALLRGYLKSRAGTHQSRTGSQDPAETCSHMSTVREPRQVPRDAFPGIGISVIVKNRLDG